MKKIPNLPEKTLFKIMKMMPTSVVECLIESPKGVLLARRGKKPFKGLWGIPGGLVAYNEKLENAVKRLIKRETGLKVKIKKYVGYYDEIKVDPRGHLIGHIFLTRIVGGKLNLNKESEEIKFFKEIPKNLVPHHRKILRRVGYR